MDYREKIQLQSKKNINSVDVDKYISLQLKKNNSIFTDYNIIKHIDSSDVFENERENSDTYRIYGTINYLSLLNGISKNYEKISDFFIKKQVFDADRNLLNSFDIYLLKPSSEFEHIKDNLYHRYYKVIAEPKDIKIKKCGYQKNIFNEDIFYFDFNLDFNIKNEKDGLGFPITDFYLYFMYKPLIGISEGDETVETVDFSNIITETPPFNLTEVEVYGKTGDYLQNTKNGLDSKISTIVELNIEQYEQKIKYEGYHIIKTREISESLPLVFIYNPFLNIKLRYLSNNITTANRNSTSYEQRNEIPYYAIDMDTNGNVLWREILNDGVFDVITNEGVDHPFVNNKKYVLNNLTFNVLPYLGQDVDDGEPPIPKPDFDTDLTSQVFEEILFSDPKVISINPNNEDINNIGKKCR